MSATLSSFNFVFEGSRGHERCLSGFGFETLSILTFFDTGSRSTFSGLVRVRGNRPFAID